jgi:hypothetical protein
MKQKNPIRVINALDWIFCFLSDFLSIFCVLWLKPNDDAARASAGQISLSQDFILKIWCGRMESNHHDVTITGF